jgi:hypothetical protein
VEARICLLVSSGELHAARDRGPAARDIEVEAGHVELRADRKQARDLEIRGQGYGKV